MLVRSVLSPVKTFTTTPSAFVNVPLDPVVTIPSTDSVMYGRTLTANDFPTYSYEPKSVKYIERNCTYGYNNSGGSATINWKSYLTPSGGSITQVGSGSQAVSNANYFNIDCSVIDVHPGDLFQVSAWSSTTTNVTINGYEMHIAPTRILPTSKPAVNVTETYTTEAVSTGLGVLFGSRQMMGKCESAMSNSPTTITSTVRQFDGDYNMYRYGRGDYNTVDSGSVAIVPLANASQVPKITISHIPTTVTFRELLLWQ